MTLGELLKDVTGTLRQACIESAVFEGAVIVTECTQKSRAFIAAHPEKEISPAAAERAMSAARRRTAGEPLQYILGRWEFYSLSFKVRPGVLIPRPETELLCEHVIKAASNITRPKILDLCCGSGCIAVAAAKELPRADVYAADLYDAPLALTAENAAANGVNISIVKADALGAPPAQLGSGFDIIVSNPPYIPSGELPSLQREVQYEPQSALDGGPDGLGFYRAICENYTPLLTSGGMLCFEAGDGECGDISAVMVCAGFDDIDVIKDYSGTDRVVFGTLTA